MKHLIEIELFRMENKIFRVTTHINNFGYIETMIYDKETGEAITKARNLKLERMLSDDLPLLPKFDDVDEDMVV